MKEIIQRSLELGDSGLAELEPAPVPINFKGETKGEKNYLVFFFDEKNKEYENIKKVLLKKGRGYEGDSKLLVKLVKEKTLGKKLIGDWYACPEVISKKFTVQTQTVIQDFTKPKEV
jgi:hypothetical protein